MGVITDLPMPLLGETMEEGRIVAWLVEPGAPYRRGETLLEVETDKTVVEVPALTDGVLVEILAGADDVIAVGEPIARVETEPAEASVVTTTADHAESVPPSAAAPVTDTMPAEARADRPGRRRASPAARRLARRHRIDLAGITGTGRRGRLSSADVARALDREAPAAAGDGQAAGYYLAADGDLAVTRWEAAGREKGRAVLLHGLFGDGGSWSLPGRQLARNGWSVQAPDLPGHGDTSSEVTGLEDMAGLIGLFLRDRLTGPVDLVGHSIGAIIAAKVAARWPDLVARLVLLAPAGIGPRINQDFIDGMLQARTTAALARALAELGSHTPVSDAMRRRMLAQLARRRDRLAAICGQIAAGGMQQQDITPALAALECPVTAVFARDDRIIPWSQAGDMPANVNVRFLAHGGHMPQWSAPAFVASLLA